MTDEQLMKAAQAYPGYILPPFDELVKKVGYECVCAFAETFGGCQVYIPAKQFIFKDCLERMVKDEYDGRNRLLLVRKYGLSDKKIRTILKG